MTPSPASPPLLELRGLSFAYGPRAVLDGLDLELEPGRLAFVIGRNGGGKTTLLRLAAGVLAPARGQVLLGGAPLASQPRKQVARTLAYVPQRARVDFPFRALEVVLQGRHPHLGLLASEGESDARIARASMAALGIDGLADRSVTTLSGGELQLVSAAAAFAQEPAVMLLDEPTASLDPAHVRVLFRHLRECSHRGLAALVVTHDLDQAAAYADEIHALADGKILATGTPEEVLTPELLQQVYSTDLQVMRSTGSSRPVVLIEP